jgi:hypothetical protein
MQREVLLDARTVIHRTRTEGSSPCIQVCVCSVHLLRQTTCSASHFTQYTLETRSRTHYLFAVGSLSAPVLQLCKRRIKTEGTQQTHRLQFESSGAHSPLVDPLIATSNYTAS